MEDKYKNDNDLLNSKSALKDLLSEVRKDAQKAMNDKQESMDAVKSALKAVMEHKESKTDVSSWIMVALSVFTIIMSLCGAWFGTRLKLQDSFNDINNLEIRIDSLDKRIEKCLNFYEIDVLYRYKIDRLIDDFNKLNKE